MRAPKRSRIISFRLSENEYNDLRELCESEGTLKVSEYARGAVCRMIRDRQVPEPEDSDQRLRAINDAINELRLEVRRMSEAIARGPAAETAVGGGA